MIGVVEVFWEAEVIRVVEVVELVLRIKMSQEQEQELYTMYDNAASGW